LFCHDDDHRKGHEGRDDDDEKEEHRRSNFAGTWTSSDGGWVQLAQDGDRVSGDYRGSDGHQGLVGKVSGKVRGSKLEARYWAREGDVTDTGEFTLYRTQDGIVGQWFSSRGNAGQVSWSPYPSGQSPSGQPPPNQPPSSPPAVSPPPTPPVAPMANFQGNWSAANGGGWYELTQSGDQVTGAFQGGPGHERLNGQISGRVVGNKLVANFTSQEGTVTGAGTFTLYRTSAGINGSWVQSNGTSGGQVNMVPDTTGGLDVGPSGPSR